MILFKFLWYMILYSLMFLGILYIIYFVYLKIKQIKVNKSEISEKVNIILSFLHKNNINIFNKNKKASKMYIYLNKYNPITALVVGCYSEKDLMDFYEKNVLELINVLKEMYYDREYSSTYTYYDSVYSDSLDINEKIKDYKCYKEEMLFISCLLQINYMYYKTDKYILTKEQLEVFNIIKEEVSKIEAKEKELDKKEKEELFKVFKEQNDIFNSFAKSIYQ